MAVLVLQLPSLASAGSKRSPEPSAPSGSSASVCTPPMGNCYKLPCCASLNGGPSQHSCFLRRGANYAQCRPSFSHCSDSSDWLCPGWTRLARSLNNWSAENQELGVTTGINASSTPTKGLPLATAAASGAPKRQRVSTARPRLASQKNKSAEVELHKAPASREPSVHPAMTTSSKRMSSGESNVPLAVGAIVLAVIIVMVVFAPLIRRSLKI